MRGYARTTTVTMALALGALVPGAARAQDAAGALAAVEQVFHGMRTADADLVRRHFAPGARFAMLDTRSQPSRVTAQTVDGWIQSIAGSEGRWDEQVYDMVAQVDGSMASVWAPYTFYLDGRISHCGINSIEMLHDADGWKVTQISDTRRREGCPDPLGVG